MRRYSIQGGAFD